MTQNNKFSENILKAAAVWDQFKNETPIQRLLKTISLPQCKDYTINQILKDLELEPSLLEDFKNLKIEEIYLSFLKYYIETQIEIKIKFDQINDEYEINMKSSLQKFGKFIMMIYNLTQSE